MKSRLVENEDKDLKYPYLGIAGNSRVIVLFTGCNEGVYIWVSDRYTGDIRVGNFRQDIEERFFSPLEVDKEVILSN